MLGMRVVCNVMLRLNRVNHCTRMLDRAIRMRHLQQQIKILLPVRPISTTCILWKDGDSDETNPEDAEPQDRDASRDPREAINIRRDPYQDYSSRHPQDYPARHPEEYPARHPEEYLARHPQDHPARHPQDHPARHPQDHPTRHPQEYPARDAYRDRYMDDLHYRRDMHYARDRDMYRDTYYRDWRDDAYYRRDVDRGLYYRQRREGPLYYNYRDLDNDMYRSRERDGYQTRDDLYTRSVLERYDIDRGDIERRGAEEELEPTQQESVVSQVKSQTKKQPNRPKAQMDQQGVLLFSSFSVLYAMKAGKRTIHKLYVVERRRMSETMRKVTLEIVTLAAQKNIPIQYTSFGELRQLTGLRRQGVVADVSEIPLKEYKHEESSESRDEDTSPEIWLAIANLTELVVGQVFRTAYFYGTRKIITSKCATSITPDVSHKSVGVAEVLDVYHTENLEQFLQDAKGWGKQVMGFVHEKNVTVLDAEGARMTIEAVPIQEARLTQDSVIVYDHNGLSEGALVLCDQLITIPFVQHDKIIEQLNLTPSVLLGVVQQHLVSTRQEEH